MAIPKRIKEQALELRKRGVPASQVVMALQKQFPRHQADIPSQKTIYRWSKEQKQATTFIATESRQDHYGMLSAIARSIVGDLDDLIETYDEQGKVKYVPMLPYATRTGAWTEEDLKWKVLDNLWTTY